MIARFAQAIRDRWRAATAPPSAPTTTVPELIVHDPDAERPHDLDDPFFDPGVQSRIAGVIASNASKKR
jgi:hypothetical protein